MQYIKILFILWLFSACTAKEKNNNTVNTPNADSLKLTTLTDSTANCIITPLTGDSTYIGYFTKFDTLNTYEAYIEVSFRDDKLSIKEYDNIVDLADSVISSDREIRRVMFPQQLVHTYFDLRGLSKLKVYDLDNKYVGNATFERVEYYYETITSYFIAVYKTDVVLSKNGYYCTSDYYNKNSRLDYTETSDSLLAESIYTWLNLEGAEYEYRGGNIHINYSNSDTVVSIVNSFNYAYVILSTKGKEDYKILYKSTGAENIYGVTVIPAIDKKMPYLLVNCVAPESDHYYSKLLGFEGDKYKLVERQRVH